MATCDTCKTLLLAYGNDRDYEETRRALADQGVTFVTTLQGALRIVAKPRAGRPKGC